MMPCAIATTSAAPIRSFAPSLEGNGNVVHFHVVQMENDTNHTGHDSHDEELGCDFGHVMPFAITPQMTQTTVTASVTRTRIWPMPKEWPSSMPVFRSDHGNTGHFRKQRRFPGSFDFAA